MLNQAFPNEHPMLQRCPLWVQMILDKKFSGTLDQGAGWLEVFEDGDKDGVYPAALDTFSNMGRVIDSLFLRSQKIMA